ncbi:DUF1996 domain-containing protein [Streptomyces sp. J2-1]|nr:DUF1996 domain-containing protein [Streptomyces corallincola]MBV2357880.1 DUF1996 domain-containing protein [Streptomyces corallincola]
MVGGGGLAAVNVYASASEGTLGGGAAVQQVKSAPGMATIDCPDVGARLTSVPGAARADVDRELADLDGQTAAAYRQLQDAAESVRQDPASADGTIMNPLKEKRAATIGRVVAALERAGDKPDGLEAMAACTLRAAPDATGAQNGTATGAPTDSAAPGGTAQQGDSARPSVPPVQNGAGQAGNGPVVSDYAAIGSVKPNAPAAPQGADASRGTFTTECGVNAGGLFNSDNVIVAPGVTNGAHHFHDYVGNQSNNAFASDDDLANAKTSCVDQGDRSTYYWPVLRLQNGKQERDAGAPGGGTEGNAGQIVTPKQVTLTFQGTSRGRVTEMPRLLRIITGDAKAFVNGPANANASWSCTGFEDRQLKDKYPLCPAGSDVVRTFRFQSCWDGRNIDSANHRTHVAFAGPDGTCAEGFRAIPQLVQRIVYAVPAPSLNDGGRTVPLFAVDSFPEQLHKPVTDHGDFINVFDEKLMREMVECINSGRTCGAKGDSGSGGDATTAPGQGATGAPQTDASTSPAGQPTKGAGGKGDGGKDTGGKGGDQGSGKGEQKPGKNEETPSGATDRPSTDRPTDQASTGRGDDDTTKAQGAGNGSATGTAAGGGQAPAADQAGNSASVEANSAAPADQSPGAAQPPVAARPQAPVSQAEPQTSGSLAETGAQLWPAAIGILLALSGVVVLLRARRMRY